MSVSIAELILAMFVRLIEVYVFLGDDHALIDLVRYMHARGLNNGEYVVIAVHDDPYDPHQQRYFNKCQSLYLYSVVIILANSLCCAVEHSIFRKVGLVQQQI